MQRVESSTGEMFQISKKHYYLLIAFIVLLIGAVVYLAVYTDLFDRKELGNLKLARAKSMVQCYHDQFNTNTNSANYYDSVVWSVYFDYHSMISYLEKMHNKHKASGIRIYFAKYDSTEMRPIKPGPLDPPDTKLCTDLKGFCTVVVIPTVTDDSGRIIDLIVKRRTHDSTLDFVQELEQPVSQAENGGISCPPYPPSVCGGQLLKGSTLSKADSNFLLKFLPD